jgi:hypothetical protein
MTTMTRRLITAMLVAACGLGGTQPAAGQDAPLAVTVNVTEEASISRYAPLVVTPNRPLTADDGRLAIFLGATDLTAMFVSVGNALRYTPEVIVLPSGPTELIVYHVPPDSGATWAELERVPVHVRYRFDVERAAFDPGLSVNNEGQIAQGEFPTPDEPPEHRIYQDFTTQLEAAVDVERRGWRVQTEARVVGVSYREEALRFRQLADKAPNVDLAEYTVQVERGPGAVKLGHVSHGQHPYLIDRFNSRGAMGSVQLGAPLDLSVAVMNGSRVVGWSNPVGLNEPDHRIVSGTLGIELWPRQPGAFRVEGSVLDGSVLPRNGFNQGAVVDAERSRGLGVRVLSAPFGQRLQVEGGAAQSRFTNPEDPALAGDQDIVAVQPASEVAHYADVSGTLLQQATLTERLTADLTVRGRRERVPPLYQSVAAYVRPDVLQHTAEVQGRIGAVHAQYAHQRATDNLDDLTSVLTTHTRQHAVQAQTALADLLRLSTAYLPELRYQFDQTHQFGEGLPVDGGFDASHIPDQLTTQHRAETSWRDSRWSLGYGFAHTFQNNRQEGRAEDDFRTVTHGVTLSLRPIRAIDVSADLDLATDLAEDVTERTRRIGLQAQIQPWSPLTLSATYSPTRTTDNLDLRLQVRERMSVEGSWTFTWRSGERQLVRGQLFVRYSRQESTTRDQRFDLDDASRFWSVNTGFTLSLF